MAMNDNLARKYESIQPLKQPDVTPSPRKEAKPGSSSRKVPFVLGEKLLVSFFAAAFFILSVMNVTMGIEVNSANRNLQDVNRTITETKVVNENLEQKVQELSRYDRVYSVAEKNGLQMNEQNVRNVSK
ncbi:cell division protein FtsL [Atopococcus tabaci]|uniref:cell division protein FtsL n=1 Tax=Atopococcus tabaci TaxID=269774 RepID=UPI0004057FB9|nr:cell division protein FtsL [Atopococcus tabaci]